MYYHDTKLIFLSCNASADLHTRMECWSFQLKIESLPCATEFSSTMTGKGVACWRGFVVIMSCSLYSLSQTPLSGSHAFWAHKTAVVQSHSSESSLSWQCTLTPSLLPQGETLGVVGVTTLRPARSRRLLLRQLWLHPAKPTALCSRWW